MFDYDIDTVIYHGGCPDGFTAAWAVKTAYPNSNIEYIPYRYGQDPPDVTGKVVVIVDFSFKRETLMQMALEAKYLVILDHHKSAKDDLEGLQLENSEIVFDMDRSGAQIAWDYFHLQDSRPWFVDYVADRDLWRHELPNTREISQTLVFDGYFWATTAGARPFNDFTKLDSLMECPPDETKDQMAKRGATLLEAKNRECEMYSIAAKPAALTVNNKKYKVGLAGCPRAYRSDVGHLITKTLDCDFAAVYWYDFHSDEWWISCRGKDDSDIDLSEITSQLSNGGGHPKAAGFTIYGEKGENLRTYFKEWKDTVAIKHLVYYTDEQMLQDFFGDSVSDIKLCYDQLSGRFMSMAELVVVDKNKFEEVMATEFHGRILQVVEK